MTVRSDKDEPFEPNIALIDAGGDEVEEAFFDTSEKLADRTKYRLAYEADTAEVYYIEIRGDESSEQKVGYTMDLDIGTNDRFEPNRKLENATSIGPGTYDDLQILSEENDFFAIHIPAGEQVEATVQHAKDTDLDLELVNAEDQTLAFDSEVGNVTSDTTTRRLSYVSDSAQTYYIHVEGINIGEAARKYRLSVDGGESPNLKPPTPRFSYTPALPNTGEEILFNASGSNGSDGAITSYAWDFNGDGTTDATGVTPTYAYTEAGRYPVELTVTDNDGASTSIQKFVTVESSPTEPDIVDEYDRDGDGIETSELLTAIEDWRNDDINTSSLLQLINNWRSN